MQLDNQKESWSKREASENDYLVGKDKHLNTSFTITT